MTHFTLTYMYTISHFTQVRSFHRLFSQSLENNFNFHSIQISKGIVFEPPCFTDAFLFARVRDVLTGLSCGRGYRLSIER